MISSPMVAFQKPITYQGSVTANSSTSTRSTKPKPPGDKANTASQINPAMVSPTAAKNTVCRQTSGLGGTFASAGIPGAGRSSIGGFACLFQFAEDIAWQPRQIQTGRDVAELQAIEATALWYVGRGQAELRAETGAAAWRRTRSGSRRCSARSAAAPNASCIAGRVPPSEYRADAGAVHGRQLSVPGQVRLRHGRPGRSRTGAPAGSRRLRAPSAPDPVQSCRRGGRSRCRQA